MTNWLLRSMTELSSRKWISRITGRFAQSPASRRFIPRFARMYGIAIEEAEKQLHDYSTLNEFFTRRLKPGARVIDAEPAALVSPVDALITGCGPIEQGTILNVKGQDYTIEELLNRSPRMENYKNGYYMVLYLSPTDYHRIHTPIAGTIVEREHVLGKVYPVNDFGLRHMRRVLSRNERLITYMRHANAETAIVKVGAMNVSSIKYVLPLQERMDKGADLAYFEFGSTVVLLTEDDSFTPRPDLKTGLKVRMGEKLGTLATS
ncbi:archaetidylserine decarboxylase [Paenibacillus lignilyticus]|uniref:Phosphatidylserine decarboxylase proenzyme n=1 Tax=Paenibacillus lignilyticus TaxID=1172615 RepID=A0ABS5C7S1_9BACL|nr:archaetidylserine decarboxylase [Paenibacillus lignilyticus]MBP3962031.1 phosphatidylserine decarboxylase [Paenibacillus lignilyticus]